MKIKFAHLPLGAKFKHGKSIYLKITDPFTGKQMGGLRNKGNSYNWKAFDDDKLVEGIESNV